MDGRLWILPSRDGILVLITEVTQIMAHLQDGDPLAADQLLPLLYDELRKLAAAKLACERPGQTLQATALVHEAYLRLVKAEETQQWDSLGHFFAAAAEAMRRIMIEKARARKSLKRGNDSQRVALVDIEDPAASPNVDLLALDEALDKLAERDRVKADLVKLRYFGGLTLAQAAQLLGIGRSTANKYWTYAKCWLRAEMLKDASGGTP